MTRTPLARPLSHGNRHIVSNHHPIPGQGFRNVGGPSRLSPLTPDAGSTVYARIPVTVGNGGEGRAGAAAEPPLRVRSDLRAPTPHAMYDSGMRQIFISYRRDDTRAFAGRIYDFLESHYGSANVFMDSDKLRGGSKSWEEQLEQALINCSALIVVIGSSWLTLKRHGNRRIDTPDDWVAREIAFGLRHGKPIHVVLEDHTPELRADDLPDGIRELASRQQLSLRHDHFRWDRARLLDWLEQEGAPDRSETGPMDLDRARRTLGVSLSQQACTDRWLSNRVVPLEVDSTDGVRGSLTDVLTTQSAPITLIEGEPGSGKSLFLRRLAATQLKEGVLPVPIYCDLKGLRSHDGASDLSRFVGARLGPGSESHTQFMDGHRAGIWRILLDGFDEIPAVLGARHTEKAVARYASEIEELAKQGKSSIVVASRPYRSPVERGWPTLRIIGLDRPQRRAVIAHWLGDNKLAHDVEAELLVTTSLEDARDNPMLLTLVCGYFADRGMLPPTLHHAIDAFVRRRLREHTASLQHHELGAQDVLEAAENIAFQMASQPGLGLRASVTLLAERLRDSTPSFSGAVDVLRAAMLARGATGSGSFEFVHRRLQEYFATRVVMDSEAVSPIALVTEARWRETAITLLQTTPERAPVLLDAALEAIRETFDDGPLPSSVAEIRSMRLAAMPDRFDWPGDSYQVLGTVSHAPAATAMHAVRHWADYILVGAIVHGLRADQIDALHRVGAASVELRELLLAWAFASESRVLRELAFQQTSKADLQPLPPSVRREVVVAMIAAHATGQLHQDRPRWAAHMKAVGGDLPRVLLALCWARWTYPILDTSTVFCICVLTGIAAMKSIGAGLILAVTGLVLVRGQCWWPSVRRLLAGLFLGVASMGTLLGPLGLVERSLGVVAIGAGLLLPGSVAVILGSHSLLVRILAPDHPLPKWPVALLPIPLVLICLRTALSEAFLGASALGLALLLLVAWDIAAPSIAATVTNVVAAPAVLVCVFFLPFVLTMSVVGAIVKTWQWGSDIRHSKRLKRSTAASVDLRVVIDNALGFYDDDKRSAYLRDIRTSGVMTPSSHGLVLLSDLERAIERDARAYLSAPVRVVVRYINEDLGFVLLWLSAQIGKRQVSDPSWSVTFARWYDGRPWARTLSLVNCGDLTVDELSLLRQQMASRLAASPA